MNADYAAFLFPNATPGDDLNDQYVRIRLVRAQCGDEPPPVATFQAIVTEQIVSGDVSEVWAAVQQCLSAGLNRDDTFAQCSGRWPGRGRRPEQ